MPIGYAEVHQRSFGGLSIVAEQCQPFFADVHRLSTVILMEQHIAKQIVEQHECPRWLPHLPAERDRPA